MKNKGLECLIDSCPVEAFCKGYCRKHYQRLRTHGDPEHTVHHIDSPERKLHSRSRWEGECLVWQGAKTLQGYGKVNWKGRPDVRVHRLAYETAYGEIPQGLVIDHKCRNRLCIRPEHLQAVTQAENMQNLAQESPRGVSGFRGVSWSASRQKWLVVAWVNGVRYGGGRYEDLEEAKRVALQLRNEHMVNNLSDQALTAE